jgi:tubulin polyglutamylase TTLL9
MSRNSVSVNNVRRSGPFRFKTAFRNTIHDAMVRRGWRETEGDEWDLHWADREWIHEFFDTMHMHAWQKVNHFRNDRELCRKDLLVKNLKKYKRHLQVSPARHSRR